MTGSKWRRGRSGSTEVVDGHRGGDGGSNGATEERAWKATPHYLRV